MDTWADVDAITDWDTSGGELSATFSEWNNLESAEFEARGFDFRVNLTSDDSAFNITVDTLAIEVEEVT